MKQKFTAEQVIEAIKKNNGILTAAAKSLGCDRATVANYIKRYKTVEVAFREAREMIVDVAEQRLVGKLIAGEWPAIRYTLSRLGARRGWAELIKVAETDVTGERPVERLSEDERLARLVAIFERARKEKSD